MLGACRDDIYSCGFNAGMPKNICQLRDILIQIIEDSRKQMPEIMRENLFGRHTGFIAELFHFPPNVASVHRLSAPGYKNRTGIDFSGFRVAKQFAFQF